MKKIFAYITLSRPVNFAITFVSVIVAGLICSSEKSISVPIILAALSASFVGSAGNIINDYFDVEIDKLNRPERLLPSGVITKTEALIVYLLLNIAAVILSLEINNYSFAIVVFAILMIFLYSYRLKSVPLAGNFVVAFFTGFAFIYGGVAAGDWKEGIVPALFAFLINFIREITKDIEDLEGDRANNVRTFPIVYGVNKAKILITVLSSVLILGTVLPFYLSVYNIEYLLLVLFTVDLMLVKLILKLKVADTKIDFRRIATVQKIIMIFGLIAIYIGSL